MMRISSAYDKPLQKLIEAEQKVTIWRTRISKTLVWGTDKTQKAKYNQASVCCYVTDLWKSTGAPCWARGLQQGSLQSDYSITTQFQRKQHLTSEIFPASECTITFIYT